MKGIEEIQNAIFFINVYLNHVVDKIFDKIYSDEKIYFHIETFFEEIDFKPTNTEEMKNQVLKNLRMQIKKLND